MPRVKLTRHYPVLDGLRGVAALLVVLYHVALYFQLSVVPTHGYLAVDFFFMLSGYVIAHAYDHRLATSMSVRRFVLVRLIRLYPLALLGVVIGTAALLVRAHVGTGVPARAVLEAAFVNALLLPTNALLMVRPYSFPSDTPLWSLAFEIWINILYALFFRLLSRRVLIGLMAAGALFVAWAAAANGKLDVGLFFVDLRFGAARVLFPFVAGVLLQRLLSGRAQQSGQSGGRLAHLAFLPLLVILCGPDLGGWVYDAVAVLLAFPAVLGFAAISAALPRLDKIWSQLGAISYPLYVTHFPFVVVISNLANQHHWQGTRLDIAAAATYLLALIVALMAYNFYDVPVRRYLTARLMPRIPAAIMPKDADTARARGNPIGSSFPPHA
jgi:peptidoglycan/LPS O-acetylase OafA/YrhL